MMSSKSCKQHNNNSLGSICLEAPCWWLGQVIITRHLGIDRAGKTALRVFNAKLTVKTQKKSYFSYSLQWIFTMLLHCVQIELKNIQDVSLHDFPLNKMRYLFLGASLW